MDPAPSYATRFRRALDAANWTDLEALLDPNCTYHCRGETLVGVDPIVASYRSIHEWVQRSFERVRYESRVISAEGARAVLEFRDRIEHGEHSLDFRCEQCVEWDDAGRIVRIEHVDLPGEAEKAARFNRACGVARP